MIYGQSSQQLLSPSVTETTMQNTVMFAAMLSVLLRGLPKSLGEAHLRLGRFALETVQEFCLGLLRFAKTLRKRHHGRGRGLLCLHAIGTLHTGKTDLRLRLRGLTLEAIQEFRLLTLRVAEAPVEITLRTLCLAEAPCHSHHRRGR